MLTDTRCRTAKPKDRPYKLPDGFIGVNYKVAVVLLGSDARSGQDSASPLPRTEQGHRRPH